MPPLPRASVLAIGTELTTGQITNRNAAALSERLSELGIEVSLHETVPDDRELILGALDRCANVSSLLLVTGGLGPTSDDFTREVIAEWAGAPLNYHVPSWTRIETRLKSLGIPVAQSNQRQCFFPKGSEILENPAGTANAFFLRAKERWLVVLPGPPREIEAIWKSARLSARVREWFPVARRLRLRTWQCLGKSEAELGELTEKALSGSGLQIGYRAHRPFVEIKVWIPEGDEESAQPWLDQLERAIGNWVATREGADIAQALWARLSTLGVKRVVIRDEATQGVLSERLGPLLRASESGIAVNLMTDWAAEPADAGSTEARVTAWLKSGPVSEVEVRLAVMGLGTDEGHWVTGWSWKGQVQVRKEISPYRSRELLDRSVRLAAELSLKIWRDAFEASG